MPWTYPYGSGPSRWSVRRLLAFDVFHVRSAHVPKLREGAIWSSIYVGIAIAFGISAWNRM